MEAAELRTHRPTWAPIAGGAWILLTSLALIDLLRRGTADQIVVGVLVVLAGDIVAYLFGLQPCVVEWPDGLELINPLRRVRVRWSQVRDLYLRDVLVVVTDDGDIRCAGVTGTLPSSQGRRLLGMRAFPGAPQPPPDAEPKGAGAVTDRLTRRWEAARGTRGERDAEVPKMAWYPPSVALLGIAIVLVVGAFVAGR